MEDVQTLLAENGFDEAEIEKALAGRLAIAPLRFATGATSQAVRNQIETYERMGVHVVFTDRDHVAVSYETAQQLDRAIEAAGLQTMYPTRLSRPRA
jgi:hypothetical protein